jgi:hypothetical protein
MSKLSLDTLLDNNQPIYVQNNALKAQLLLIIQMKDKHGKNDSLKLPPVDLPVNISEQFSRDSIRESTDLKKVLHNGTVILVDPVVAAKRLATKEAREQQKALSLSVYADAAPSNTVRDTMERLTKKNSNSTVVNSADVLKKGTLPNDQVSLKIRGVIASFESKEKTSKDTLAKLKQMKPALTEADLTFVIGQCRSEVTIREFAEQALAELQAKPEAPFEEENA